MRPQTHNGDDMGVNFLTGAELERELHDLCSKGVAFHKALIRMRPSLRYAILALLSENKFNIFNDGLTNFMKSLNNGEWNEHDKTA